VGLTLVKRIVALRGGRVRVEPGEGDRGAVFCFTLADPPPGAAPESDG
jgi:signal transduction histidine kinase